VVIAPRRGLEALYYRAMRNVLIGGWAATVHRRRGAPRSTGLRTSARFGANVAG
jgi:hypothetical protein